MQLKTFLDQLYRASNGALTRTELLSKVNTYQNALFSRNCTEMFVRDTFTFETETSFPTYAPTLNFVDRGLLVDGVSYNINDIVHTSVGIGAGTIDEYFRVVTPFTADTIGSSTYLDLYQYCEPVVKSSFTELNLTSVAYEAGNEVVEIGTIVVTPNDGNFISTYVGPGTLTGDLLTDINLFGMIPTQQQPLILGAYSVPLVEIPEIIEFPGYREITKVGLFNTTTKDYQTIYTPQIVQNDNPDGSVKIYTEDLPENTELTFEGYRFPNQLTSEQDVMEVPEIHQEGVLRSYVMVAVEEENYGNSSYWIQKLEVEKQDWFNYINRDLTSPRRKKTTKYNPLAG